MQSWNAGFSIGKLVNFRPQKISDSDAWVGHLHFANFIIQKIKPRIFVELGVYTGNSYLSFCQSIKSNNLETKAFGVDTWAGDIHMGPQDSRIFGNLVKDNSQYSEFSTLIRKTFDDAVSDFKDKSIDLLHIDGTHTYQAVKNDFDKWLPKLSEGATVLFHDINVYQKDFGVHRFWSEIQNEHSTLSFYHSNGLGVLQMPGTDLEKRLPFDNEVETDEIRNFFFGLGEGELIRYKQLNEIDTLLIQNEQLRSSYSQLRSSYSELTASYSWKVTKWLRSISRPFMK